MSDATSDYVATKNKTSAWCIFSVRVYPEKTPDEIFPDRLKKLVFNAHVKN